MWLALLVLPAMSGEVATTASGREVMLNDDGTWEALPDASASTVSTETCAALIASETHPSTGQPLSTMKAPLRITSASGVGLETLAFYDHGARAVTWNVAAVGRTTVCVNREHTLLATFTDGGTLSMTNGLPLNCDGSFGVAFTRDHERMSRLASAELKTLRLHVRDGYMEVPVSASEATRLRESFACLRDAP